MRKIVFSRPDGGITVVTPVRNTYPRLESLTDAEIEQRAWDRLPAEAIDPQWVEADAIPKDRTFRDGWTSVEGRIEHDMAKCREIHKARLRKEREPLLLALDTEYMRADESGDSGKKAQIAEQKQALRDITKDPRIANAKTPDDLKKVTL